MNTRLRPRYVQVSSLPFDKQLQAKRMLGVRDPLPESDKSWCRHPKSAIVKYDLNGSMVSDEGGVGSVVEVCGMCPTTESVVRYRTGG